MVKVKNSKRRDIVRIAQEIYDQQTNIDTPPAEMTDVTELLLMLAKRIKSLEQQVKRLQGE